MIIGYHAVIFFSTSGSSLFFCHTCVCIPVIAIYDKMISLCHVTITQLVYNLITLEIYRANGIVCIFCVLHFLHSSFVQNIIIISNLQPNIVYRVEGDEHKQYSCILFFF